MPPLQSMREQRRNVDVDTVVFDLLIAHPPDRHGRHGQCRSVLARVGHFEPRDNDIVECPDIKQLVLDVCDQCQEVLRRLRDIFASDDRVAIGINKRAVFRQEAR